MTAVPSWGYGTGAVSVACLCAITPQDTSAIVNLQNMPPGQQIPGISTLYIDASDAPLPIIVTMQDTGQAIDVPAYTQGFFPVSTNSKNFTVSCPLAADIGSAFSVLVQALSYAVPPFQTTTLPNQNAGVVQLVGNASIGWTSFAFDVPTTEPVYNSLQIDCSSYGAPVTVSGVDIDGSPWEFTQAAFTSSETPIPATAGGSAATATTAASVLSPATFALIPLRWRVAFAGAAASSTLPSAVPPTLFAWTSLTGIAQTQTVAPIAGRGFYVASVSVFAVGVTEPWTLLLTDDTTAPVIGSEEFFSAAFASGGTQVVGVPIGWTTAYRTSSIVVTVQSASVVAACQLVVQLNIAPVPASRNG